MAIGNTFISMLVIATMIVSSFSVMFGMYQYILIHDEADKWPLEYIIPGAIGNTLVVIFLLYTIATSVTRKPTTKLFIILILIAGLFSEIYMVNQEKSKAIGYGAISLIAFNFLVRVYYILDFNAFRWISLRGDKPIVDQDLVKEVADAVGALLRQQKQQQQPQQQQQQQPRPPQ